ncbi:hypothetical protein SAMN04487948_12226 [Halogranum amylolyticum]|uniref:Uncharacterized protein n=1 Tax=Halogranum amylolyticum TaxID=660520 RepID=A0A1H8W1S8_9EURY|nr:hypothetical protein [Halogranum amylolyticum]SEP21596.1 hypothetical protein SAMN04487948_12226 [Halogranum amylolyticum]
MRENHADWEALREELDWDDAETDPDETTMDEPRLAVTPKP